MISNNGQNKPLPNELTSTFKELQVLKYLKKAGITKTFGFSCGYLFQLIFCLIFKNKNWFRTFESKKSDEVPAKDAVYRFLNKSTFAWHRFLLFLSVHSTYQRKERDSSLYPYYSSQWSPSQSGFCSQP